MDRTFTAIIIGLLSLSLTQAAHADSKRFIQRINRESKSYLAAADINKDNMVSRQEYAANSDVFKPVDFNKADLNADGFLSLDEIKMDRKSVSNARRAEKNSDE